MNRLKKKMLKILAEDNIQDKNQETNNNPLSNNNSLTKFGDEYRNEDGKITPYHILLNDFSDEIVDMEKEDAIDFCVGKIKDIDEDNIENEEYEALKEDEIQKFEDLMRKSNDSLDLIFTLKDIVLDEDTLTKTSKKQKKRFN